jgi:hypothetical protein
VKVALAVVVSAALFFLLSLVGSLSTKTRQPQHFRSDMPGTGRGAAAIEVLWTMWSGKKMKTQVRWGIDTGEP